MRFLLFIITLSSIYGTSFFGYLKEAETSFCMDECSQYYIETEVDPGFGSINVILDNLNVDIYMYLNRFIEVELGEEISCIECSAYEIDSIKLSDECQYPVDCFVDPCLAPPPCELNTPVDCFSNYCGGCYADFYDMEDNLVDCYLNSNCEGENPAGCFQNGCPDSYDCIDDWANNCVPSSCGCDESIGQWICTDDCNGGTCIESDSQIGDECVTQNGEMGFLDCLFDCTSELYFDWLGDGICDEGPWRILDFNCEELGWDCGDCNPDWDGTDPSGLCSDACIDLSGLFFGLCDMYLGVGYMDGSCQNISGCGWDVDGVDYSGAFFDTIDQCENICNINPDVCEDIEYDYDQLHSGDYATCEFDNDCMAVWGHCDVGLGGCHYSVNEDAYLEEEINTLVNLWIQEDCMTWVCDCSAEPYAQCIDGTCTSAYCMEENPAGCFQTGCDEGYECVALPNDCVASSCGCDGFYGDWYCTEDCGGGTCVTISSSGDFNNDDSINILDVIILVNHILSPDTLELEGADMNNDGMVNILDVIVLINIILSR